MVGKPCFPPDVDGRDDLKGAAAATPGLTALDEEREASLADEGGASGMRMETQDLDDRRHLDDDQAASHVSRGGLRGGRWGLAGAVVVCAMGAVVARRFLR